MKNLYFKIHGLVFALFILNSSFLIPNCLCQWVQVNNGMGNVPVYAFATSGNNIFAGCEYPYGVYLSTNNGTNWTQTSLNNQTVFSLAINGNNIFAGADLTGVFLSTNNGTNWTQTSLNNRSLRALIVSGNYIFAGTSNFGVYLSTNNGTSWTQTSLNNRDVLSLASSGNNIFAGTSQFGVYLSTNNGTNWTQAGLNNQTVYSLAVNGNNVFAGTYLYGVYLSTNNGTNWTQTSLGNNQDVRSLAVNGNNVFAGTETFLNGVYVSNNNGTSWTQRNEGLGQVIVRALSILNIYIFAGTSNSVWRRPLGELVGIQPVSNEVPDKFSLGQNYPNPFNPKTIINYELRITSYVQLKVFDILGREVSLLVNSKLEAGKHEAIFDGTNYPSGVYFYTFTAGEFIQSKKMILLK